MASIGDLLGKGGIGEQLLVWGVLNQLVAGALAPYQRELENLANSRTQAVPLSPADLARLVIRNYRSQSEATDEAKENGISPDDFADLVKSTGNPPSPEALAEALRRGLIPEDAQDSAAISFRGGIRQGDLQDKWAELIKELAVAIPTPNDALDALLEGQIDQATALDLFRKFGGDPTYFQMLFDTRGTAPTPNEALVLANRGIIPWEGSGPEVTSFEQAFLEGPWRNKWLPSFRKLGEYLPPPRTVTALVHAGALTDQQALAIWEKSGLSQELAQAYLVSAHSAKTSAHRHLTLGIIEALYEEHAIGADEAHSLIVGLGYSEEDANFILSYNQLKRELAAINRGINTVHTNYINHHIDRATASGHLDTLGLASAQRDELLTTWTVERTARVAVLTPAQIKKADERGLLNDGEAIQRLTNMGYSERDAGIFLKL